MLCLPLCTYATLPHLQEYCPSGHRCSNQMFTKREYSKLEVVSWRCAGCWRWRSFGRWALSWHQ